MPIYSYKCDISLSILLSSPAPAPKTDSLLSIHSFIAIRHQLTGSIISTAQKRREQTQYVEEPTPHFIFCKNPLAYHAMPQINSMQEMNACPRHARKRRTMID